MREEDKNYILNLIENEETKIKGLLAVINKREQDGLKDYYLDLEFNETELSDINENIKSILTEIDRLKYSLGANNKWYV